LLPDQDGQVISPIVMQEQIVELQERVARLEMMSDRPTPPEPLTHPPAPIPEPPPEVDPLLNRLALLLEDF